MPPESANHRTAFTLYLADPTNRAPGNTKGEERKGYILIKGRVLNMPPTKVCAVLVVGLFSRYTLHSREALSSVVLVKPMTNIFFNAF